jgi:hypothetical protein
VRFLTAEGHCDVCQVYDARSAQIKALPCGSSHLLKHAPPSTWAC